MIRTALLALALLASAGQAFAAEEKRCRFDLAILANGQLREIRQSVTIRAERHQARIRVTRKGDWGALRQRTSDGSDLITFDTATTVETITIRPRGEARWDIRYKGARGPNDSVDGYSGKCGIWSRLK